MNKPTFKEFLEEKYIHYVDTVKEVDSKIKPEDEEKDINNKDKRNMDKKLYKYSQNLIKYIRQNSTRG
jgi:protein associated with RNAse G/E